MIKIEGNSLNSSVNQFWCKSCHKSTNIIYKDATGATFCPDCVDFSEKTKNSSKQIVVEEES